MKIYSIGEMAKLSGCSVQLIRHYEDIKIISKPGRTQSNRRFYGEQHLKELQFIRHGRSLGFSLDDITSLLVLKNQPHHNQQAHDIAEQHLQKVDQRIKELLDLQATLQSIIKKCEKTPNSEPCPIIHLLDDHKDGHTHKHKPSPL
ncbi:MAG: MerR family DNA-binding protein [Alphaproteobacteria bacterium]